METHELPFVAAILFSAYLIRGISGFGSALLAVPLLAHILPLPFTVPLVVTLDLIASSALSASGWRNRHIHWQEIRRLLPASLVGIAVGVSALARLPQEPLMLALGLFIVAFGIRSALDLHGERPISRWWALPAGFSGGAIGALFATGGPPFVIYLSHRLHDPSETRATFSSLFMLEGSARLLSLGFAGLLFQDGMLTALLTGLPAMAAGMYIGHHLHLGLGRRQLFLIIGLLLIGSGGSLLWRALY
jgi:uncharacterized membrane protein YfcA